MAFAPIFIVGVPRSGTTLLRVLLDSHSEIAALPETPWLLGAYGPDPSLRGVLQGLIEGPFGAVRNVSGVEPDHILAAGRSFLETLFEPLLRARNKRLIAFKTPADIRHLDFLVGLLPDARFIHITRDGRDVAMSQLAKKGSFFNDLKEYRRVAFANLLRRWVEWEGRIRDVLYRDGLSTHHVRYEDLVAQPERELRRIATFLGVPFEPAMLDYASARHDYPGWEAGSTDVAHHSGISASSAGKWRQARMTAGMVYALTKYEPALVAFGYPASRLSPAWPSRVLAALFPLVHPLLDAASRGYGVLRPLLKSRMRVLACAAWAGLAGQFLIPAIPATNAGFASDAYQPAMSFMVALVSVLAFGPALLRRLPIMEGAALAAVAVAAALGLLEVAQGLAPGREASAADFFLNAGGGLLALAAISLFKRTSLEQAGPSALAT